MFTAKMNKSVPGNFRSRRHTDKPLTNILTAMFQADNAFIADKVFPIVTVKNSTDFYYNIPRGYFNRNQMQRRGRGADPAIANFDYEKTPFNVDIYALMVAQTDEDESDIDNILSWDTDATEFLTGQARLQREISFNDNFFKAGVWETTRTGIATGTPTSSQFRRWSDAASTPIKDVRNARRTVLESTGKMLNTMTIDYDTKDVLMEHPEIIDRLNRGQTPGGAAQVDMNDLKKLFEVDNIYVGSAIHNVAIESSDPDADDDHQFIMSNGALLTHTPVRAGRRQAAAGYNFVWDVYSSLGMRMRKYRNALALADFHIIDDAYKQNQVSGELGYFFDQTGTLV